MTTTHPPFHEQCEPLGPAQDPTHFTLKSSAVILLLSMFRRILLVSMAAHRIWKGICRREAQARGFFWQQMALQGTSTRGHATLWIYESIHWGC